MNAINVRGKFSEIQWRYVIGLHVSVLWMDSDSQCLFTAIDWKMWVLVNKDITCVNWGYWICYKRWKVMGQETHSAMFPKKGGGRTFMSGAIDLSLDSTVTLNGWRTFLLMAIVQSWINHLTSRSDMSYYWSESSLNVRYVGIDMDNVWR